MPRLRLIEAFVIIRNMKSSGAGECEMATVSRSVCHGSSVIVKQPHIVKTKYTKDFGIDGRITRSAFWELAKFKHPTHQMCFCSERALTTLSFAEAEEVYDE